MPQITTAETPIDKLIYQIVAANGGASNYYEEICDELSEALSPTKTTRILRGSASIDWTEIRALHHVLSKHKPDLTLEAISQLFS